MTRALFCVLIAWFAVACAPDHVDLPATMTVSPEFSPEEAEAIFAAADAWSAATKGVARLDVSVGDGGTIHIARGDAGDGDMGSTTLESGPSASITIDADVATAHRYKCSAGILLQSATMHELGHAFGLGHDSGTLMDPVVQCMTGIDDKTLARFCENYSCAKSANALDD